MFAQTPGNVQGQVRFGRDLLTRQHRPLGLCFGPSWDGWRSRHLWRQLWGNVLGDYQAPRCQGTQPGRERVVGASQNLVGLLTSLLKSDGSPSVTPGRKSCRPQGWGTEASGSQQGCRRCNQEEGPQSTCLPVVPAPWPQRLTWAGVCSQALRGVAAAAWPLAWCRMAGWGALNAPSSPIRVALWLEWSLQCGFFSSSLQMRTLSLRG